MLTWSILSCSHSLISALCRSKKMPIGVDFQCCSSTDSTGFSRPNVRRHSSLSISNCLSGLGARPRGAEKLWAISWIRFHTLFSATFVRCTSSHSDRTISEEALLGHFAKLDCLALGFSIKLAFHKVLILLGSRSLHVLLGCSLVSG